jgi:hypothetical protein
MKIHPVGAELFHVDITNLTAAFCNFANTPRRVCHTGMNIYVLLTVKQPLQPLTASNYILIYSGATINPSTHGKTGRT